MNTATRANRTDVGPAEASILAGFEHRGAGDTGAEWAVSLRSRAMATFADRGFPTRRDEDWRFTPLGEILGHAWSAAAGGHVSEQDVERFTFGALAAHLVVLIDGRFSKQHSHIGALPTGVRIESLAAALEEDHVALRTSLAQYALIEANPFVALNTANICDGAMIVIPRGAKIDLPVHILSLSTARQSHAVSHPRVLVLAGGNCQASIVESYAGLGKAPYWTNCVTEISVGDGAIIEHLKVHREGDQALHTATCEVRLDRAATYTSQNITLGGLLTRNDINATLAGEGVSCTLNGLYLANGDQLVDNHTAIAHAMPHCESHELYKGILDGNARGVFNGKIFVAPDAQKTDAKQTNKTLLLSKNARIDTKPQLEIYADDVKCTHGATVGQPDDEAIFYLRSRGIGEADARAMMTYAFAADVIDRVKIPEIRRELSAAVFGIGSISSGDISDLVEHEV